MLDTAGLPIRISRYELVERIGVGGMAEVFRARHVGTDGFEKTVVIKKLFPHLSAEQRYTRMFVDEATLAARIQHPNVVQVYELDRTEHGELFIVMEHVAGPDLRVLLAAANRGRVRIPVWFSLFIVGEVVNALACAHALRDEQGQPLQIVHRDVTPANVFISRSGEVKLGDFGIAKSAAARSQTAVGEIKGKIAYLAPEQILQRKIDHRADLFAVGAVLWECLTQRRLFTGADDVQVLVAIRSGARPPPSDHNDEVPPELDQLVLETLEADPDRRVQTAVDLQRRIVSILSAMKPDLISSDVRQVLETIDTAGAALALDGIPVVKGEPIPGSSSELPSSISLDIDFDDPDLPTRTVIDPALSGAARAREALAPQVLDATPRPPFFLRDRGTASGPWTYAELVERLIQAAAAGAQEIFVSGDERRWMALARFVRLTGEERLLANAPVPSVQGNLTERSLIRVLLDHQAVASSGRLILTRDDTPSSPRREIHLVDGAITYVYSDSPEASIPETLVRLGLIGRDALVSALHDVLLEDRALELVGAKHAAGVDLTMHWPVLMRNRLVEVFAWTAGCYAFEPSADAWRSRPFARSPLRLYLEMANRSVADPGLVLAMSELMDARLVPSQRLEVALRGSGLTPAESQAVHRLVRGASIRQVLPDDESERRQVLIAAHVLIEGGLLLPARTRRFAKSIPSPPRSRQRHLRLV